MEKRKQLLDHYAEILASSSERKDPAAKAKRRHAKMQKKEGKEQRRLKQNESDANGGAAAAAGTAATVGAAAAAGVGVVAEGAAAAGAAVEGVAEAMATCVAVPRKKKKRKTKKQTQAAIKAAAEAAAAAAKPKMKRRVVEVVAFDDPTSKMDRQSQFEKKAKGRFMSAEVSKVHTVPTVLPSDSDDDSDGVEYADGMSMSLSVTDLLELGKTQFDGKTKRQWEKRRMLGLGAKASKPQKAPIAVLTGMRAKQAQRAEKQKQLDIATGMYRKPAEQRASNKMNGIGGGRTVINGGRWVDKSTIEDHRFRNGVLKVDPKMFG